MDGRCDKHLFEAAEARCGQCDHEFCPECLVYSFGPRKPPFCIPCAVAAAGIRLSASRPRLRPEAGAASPSKARWSIFRRAREPEIADASGV